MNSTTDSPKVGLGIINIIGILDLKLTDFVCTSGGLTTLSFTNFYINSKPLDLRYLND